MPGSLRPVDRANLRDNTLLGIHLRGTRSQTGGKSVCVHAHALQSRDLLWRYALRTLEMPPQICPDEHCHSEPVRGQNLEEILCVHNGTRGNVQRVVPGGLRPILYIDGDYNSWLSHQTERPTK